MENLSIVIRDTEDKIYEHLEVMKPLLEDNRTQIVLINNEVEKFNLPYEYSLYEFREDYSKFKEFYRAVCLHENIILIEKGMRLDKIIVNSIKRYICKNANLKIKIKKFIDKNKVEYLDYDIKILFNYKAKEIEYLDDLIIKDLSLIEFSLEDIQPNLYKLVELKQYKTIYEWYSACISYCGDNYEEKFFEELENLKHNLKFEELEEINTHFLINRGNDRYKSFLIIKSLYEEKNEGFEKHIKNLLSRNDFNGENIYFSNFIKLLFKEKDHCIKFIKYVDLNAIYTYIEYLLEIDNTFYLDIYNFIISIDLNKEISIDNNEKILVIVNIIKTYISYMGYKSSDIEKKNILIQMFLDYSNYGFYNLNRLINIKGSLNLDDEAKFLIEMDKAASCIDKGLVNEAIYILRRAGEEYELMVMPVRYYIQRLIRDNNIYPYKLSICIMAKNEEKFLDKCLNSIKPLLDDGIAELIFVDTGSTDRTVEIANKYINKIYHEMWEGNFSKMRNYTISLATGEYIFIMDADYEVEKCDIDKIIYYFSQKEYVKYGTTYVNIKNFADEKYISFSTMTQALIFKNDAEFHYTGTVHNQPICKGPFKILDVTILHYGYIMTEDIKDKKFERTARLLKRELQKEPQNLYYRMQLSTSYSMHSEPKKALEQVDLYMKLFEGEELTNGVKLMACNNAVVIYLSNGLYEKSIEVCNRGLKVEPTFIDLVYNKALANFALEEYCEAIQSYENYLKLIENVESLAIINDNRYIFYSLNSVNEALGKLLICYYEIKDFENFNRIVKRINENTLLQRCIYTIIKFYVENKRYYDLKQFFIDKIIDSANYDVKYLFSYFIIEVIGECSEEEKSDIVKELETIKSNSQYLESIKTVISSENYSSTILEFINKYSLDELDLVTAKMIIDKTYPLLINLDIITLDIEKVKALKNIALFILNNTVNAKMFKGLSKNDVLTITKNYISLCTMLISEERYDLITEKEIKFTKIIKSAFQDLRKNNQTEGLRKIRDSVIVHEEMARPMQLYLETVIHGYDAGLEYFNNSSGEDKMNNELIEYSKTIKSKIEELINTNSLEESKNLIEEYEKIIKVDLDIYSMKSIILIMEGKLDEAEDILFEGLNIDSENFDLNYNLAYVCVLKEEYSLAFKYYNKAFERCNNESVKEEIGIILDNMKMKKPNLLNEKKKIVFFDKGDDKFIGNIINELSKEYQTQKVTVRNMKEIDEWMQWADICWFEWCDELIAYGSKHNLASEKKIICRIHSYEAFTSYPFNVDWKNVDQVIFVSELIKNNLCDKVKIDNNRIYIIPNGIDTTKYSFKNRGNGFNIAYVGFINYKKGPMLLIHTFKAILDKDSRYKLYIAGKFQDQRDILYFNQMIKEFGLENNLFYQGWQDDLDGWLEDKNYVLCTSILESQNVSVMQAMSKGIKPVVHNFVGARNVYPNKYIWNTIDEAISIIQEETYNSEEYRDFIKEHYSLEEQISKTKKCIRQLEKSNKNIT